MKQVKKCYVRHILLRFAPMLLAFTAPFCIGLGLAAKTSADIPPDLERVTLQLRWFHQFQFAGYYAALEKGYYREAGLDVVIQERDMQQDPVEMVSSGQADYGVTNSELLLHALRGDSLVVLAAIFQHSPLVLLARGGTGIYTPHDLVGARVKMTEHSRDVEIQAMLTREGISMDQLQLVDSEVGQEDFRNPDIEALSAYVTNEPFYLKEKGEDFQILWPRHYGIDFYGDSLFTSSDEIRFRPDRVKAFRKASIKGWEYAMEHPEEIVELIQSRYNPHKSREHLLFESRSMYDLIQPEFVKVGHVNPGRWRHIARVFEELGYVQPEQITDDFFDGFIYDPELSAYNLTSLWRWIWLLGGALAVAGMILAVLLYFVRQQRRIIKIRRQSEDRIQKINHELQLANQQKDKLFSIISHDLRSPMSSLLSATQMLAASPESFSPDELSVLSRELNNNTKNTFDLLEDLLQWSRMCQGGIDYAPESCNLKELASSSLSTIMDMAEKKNIAVTESVPPDLQVWADRSMIKTVIRNIFINAVKFTPRTGEIFVSARRKDENVEICIRDNGTGMDGKNVDSVFAIHKSKRQIGTEGEKGTGLGLIICREFVERNLGRIWIESEPGRGTTVCFTVPAAQGGACVSGSDHNPDS